MNINKLKAMNENERMEWIVNASNKDLGIVLKNEGVKGISNMKKLEKLAMVAQLVVENSVTDEDAKRIMEDTERLKKEIEIRQCYAETIEGILYARYKNKEIKYNELRKVCNAYNIDIPLSYNEKNSIKIVDEYCNLFSLYEHHDDNYTYYSILDKNYEWDNMYRKNNMCEDWDWDVKKFYEMNTVDDGNLQLACIFDENCNYMLCMYKNYELLGTFVDGDIYDIKVVVDYDDRLTDEDLDTYSELLDLLNEQQDEYCRIVETDKMLRNKLNCTEENADFIVDEQNKKIIILNNELLK